MSLTGLNLSFSDLGCFNQEFDILQFKTGNRVIKSQDMELSDISRYIKMLTYQELIGLSCVAMRCCSSLHKQHFVVLQKRHLERRIISKHEDIYWSQRSP